MKFSSTVKGDLENWVIRKATFSALKGLKSDTDQNPGMCNYSDVL